MIYFNWIRGSLEGTETDHIEFHAVDPALFMADLWCRDGEWLLHMTRKVGSRFVSAQARIPSEDLEAEDVRDWASRKLSEFL